MSKTIARIKAKGLESTGVTEQIARSYFDRLGSHHLAIVEYQVDSRTVDSDGHQQVQLSLTAVEPVVDGELNGQLDDHIRTIQKALYKNRKLAEGKDQPLPLDGDGPEPSVKDVLAQGIALLDQDEAGDTVLWDGDPDPDSETETDDSDGEDEIEDPDGNSTDPDPDSELDEPEPATPDDASYDVHGFLVSPDGDSCEVCRQPAAAAVHDLDPVDA